MLSRDFYYFIVFEAFRKPNIGALALSLTLTTMLLNNIPEAIPNPSPNRKYRNIWQSTDEEKHQLYT